MAFLQAIDGCVIPQVGQSVIHNQYANSARPNNTTYKLTRSSESEWVVEFNAVFVFGRIQDSSSTIATPVEGETGSGPELIAEMRRRTEYCFAEASSAMRGPRGERLSLALTSPTLSQEPDQAPRIYIGVNSVPGRGDATNFNTQFDCPTIIHEFLHHAGLCDEYIETGSFENAGSCRVVIPDNSIMAEDMKTTYHSSVEPTMECEIPEIHRTLSPEKIELAALTTVDDILRLTEFSQLATMCSFGQSSHTFTAKAYNLVERRNSWQFHFPRIDMTNSFNPLLSYYIECACPANDSTCRDQTNRLKETLIGNYSDRPMYQCPAGYTQILVPDASVSPGSFSVVDNQRIRFRSDALRTRRSLLYPAHFNRILQGSCVSPPDRLTPYENCARFAYKHSEPENSCSVIPPECRSRSYFLGAEQPPVIQN